MNPHVRLTVSLLELIFLFFAFTRYTTTLPTGGRWLNALLENMGLQGRDAKMPVNDTALSGSASDAAALAPTRIENAVGVCGVAEDTILLAEAADQGAPGRALDLGTGTGYVAIWLAQHGWEVDAVDVSPRALALAQHNARANGVNPHIFYSDRFGAVAGSYDVIACNPPMRWDETESSRVVTAALRGIKPLARLLMYVTEPVLSRRRLGLTAELAREARTYLTPGGRLILVISPLEEAALPTMAPGLVCRQSRAVGAIPNLKIVTFTFDQDRA